MPGDNVDRPAGRPAASLDAGAASVGERLSPLSTPSATREVLEVHGLATKYSLGQNFLVNDDILRKILELAEVDSADCVLEVGPGIGTLTIALVKHAAAVVAVECDPDLPAVLEDTLAPWREKFALIEKDALDVREDDIVAAAEMRREFRGCFNRASSARRETAQWAVSPKQDCLSELKYPRNSTGGEPQPLLPNKLISNLPYAVAASVVLGYFERFPFIQSATVMVQKEVADRMAAHPGTKNYGAYTVKLGLYARVTGRFTVGSGNFFPPPRVESAVIRLDRCAPLDENGVPATREVVRGACTMADAAFFTRRKTLANSCKAYFAGRGEAGKAIAESLSALFEICGIDPTRRGETLSQQEFLRLGSAFVSLDGTRRF